MQQVTINTDNFDFINSINLYRIINNSGYITKAKDRQNQDGILLFIPSVNINDDIRNLKE